MALKRCFGAQKKFFFKKAIDKHQGLWFNEFKQKNTKPLTGR